MKTDLRHFLSEQKANHLYRSRMIIDGPQQVEVMLDGKPYVNFCSNDYLGHASHPKVSDAFMKGVQAYGVGSGASHLITGHSRAHHDLEVALAGFVGRPRALLFSTGYMANLGVISSLAGRGDRVFEDRLNHASLLDGAIMSGARLQRFHHRDVQDLKNKLLGSQASNNIVVSDGVFSMDGDLAPIRELAVLARENDSWLLVDDAHGLGVLGQRGRGLLEQESMSIEEVPILVGTLGKALGTFGAFVAGDEDLIEFLIQKARSYIYTTALPPAVAYATRASLQLVDDEPWRRQRLQENIQLWQRLANDAGISLTGSSTAIQPVIIGGVEQTVRISRALHERRILVTAIRPPTVPDNTARLRITLCTTHTDEHIHRLVDCLCECGLGK